MQNCNRCGKCCANILMLTDEEIHIIKKYIHKHKIPIINRNNILLNEDVNICPFLSEDNKQCNIYEVRPNMCRCFNCNNELSETMNYKGVKAINMLLTFGGDNVFSVNPPDLKYINDRIKQLQKKLKL